MLEKKNFKCTLDPAINDAGCFVKCAGGVRRNVTRKDKTLSAPNLNDYLIF